MKMRILSLALAAALLAGGLTGCKKPETGGEIITNDKSELEKIMNLTGLPIAKEPGGITLKVFVGTNPNATASPCKRAIPRMIDKLSMACPIVCPKFNTLRSPCSLGSWETISPFIVTERRISSRKSSGLVS